MMKALLLLSSAWMFLQGCKAQPVKYEHKINEDNNSLLWRVTGKGLKKPSYLFGTFHLLCKEVIHMSDQLKNSLKSADVLYLELDMDDPAVLLGGLLMMNMKDGKKLKDLYTE